MTMALGGAQGRAPRHGSKVNVMRMPSGPDPDGHALPNLRRTESSSSFDGPERRGEIIRGESKMKDIGECAGKVWQVLQKSGKAPLKAVTKETGLTWSEINRAVGWLARENKISIVEEGKTQALQLNGSDHS
jgi:hypothetical protein